ncbi:MAG: hypothetical protein A3F42_05160 [Gammaproteobacteria bacterium RIFCSPHIGHO2_12_FULL_37_34]|nr:MAG: hypothetical protein A3F42_05160 [Gammaproteobacteria bacterium RIFCSPHIGHO2_12_FULL_37_34]
MPLHADTCIYKHVNVFSNQPLCGNSLAVFYLGQFPDESLMLRLTQEMKHYESIFLTRELLTNTFNVRIYSKEEELEFAGHPILGAASALHDWLMPMTDSKQAWRFLLRKVSIQVTTSYLNDCYRAEMDQGIPHFGKILTSNEYLPILHLLNLNETNLYKGLPVTVVSTGFPYLIIPLKQGLENAKILTEGLEELLKLYAAKEVYVFDVQNREGRNWNNHVGTVEDSATGSAAGIVGAYLVKYGQGKMNTPIVIHQGRFVNRPSVMSAVVFGDENNISSVHVSGDNCIIADGKLDARLFQKYFINKKLQF